MVILEGKKVITREKRVSAITAYQGNNQTLQDDIYVSNVKQRIRTFSQGNKDEIIEALNVLSRIRDVSVIIHGGIGCSAAELNFYEKENQNIWYSTDLNERDSIMGGDEKLRKTVERVHKEHKSKVIFIVGTPLVAINNDDINSVILELEDKLNTKIISIYTDGFKSQVSMNGIDIVLHSLAKYIINSSTGEEKENFLNLISISENENSIGEITRMLKKLGIKWNLIPQLASVSDLERAHLAKVSIGINDDESDILLQGLLEKAQVPFIKSRVPIGIGGTSDWLHKLGISFDIQEQVDEFISQEEARIEKYTGKQPLINKKVFIDLPASAAIELAVFIQELGGKITGISVDHIDQLNRDQLKNLSKEIFIKVGEGQPFELINILSKNKPDFYIGSSDNLELACKLGISPISVELKILYGYEGIVELIKSFEKAEERKGFVKYLSKNTELPYSEAWLRKSSNWHIKQEVK